MNRKTSAQLNDLNLNSRGLGWFVIAAIMLAWFCVDGIFVPPDFGHTDIYYFKDSGINFAEGLGLTTRFSYGNPTFAYRDYAQYPPVYPLAFGIYTKVAGVSVLANQMFNSLVAMLVGLAGFLALRPIVGLVVSSNRRMAAEFAVALLSVMTGYYYFSYDRPDGLATFLGIAASVSAIRGTRIPSALAAGALCALVLFVSPFAGIWASLGVVSGLLVIPARGAKFRFHRLIPIVLGGMAMLLVALGSLRLWLPGWFDGFFGVATGSNTHNETGGGYFLALLRGDFSTWWSGFAFAGPETYVPLWKLCAVDAALVWTMIAESGRRARGHALRLLPLLIVSPLAMLTAPYQANYLTITAGLMLAAWASIEAVPADNDRATQRRAAAAALLAAFAFNVILTAPFEARDLLVRWNTRESLERALAYLNSHRNALESRAAYTAVSPTSYILWRQANLHPLIEIYSGFRIPENRKRLAVLALSYPGSGNALLPQPAEFIPEGEYALASEPTLPQEVTVLGHPLSKSSQTWESAIYTRRP